MRQGINLTFVFALLFGVLGSWPLQAAEKLTLVPAQKVCMVNNELYEKDQIPVQVGEKTYYGCCQMCKKTLGEDVQARTAVDPVSGKSVDKATAVIAARENGSILYFENKSNFEKYVQKQKSVR